MRVCTQEIGKFLQECVRSDEAFEPGSNENRLIYRDLTLGGQKSPVLEVGRVTPCAGFWCLNERRAEDCPPYRQ